MPTRVPAHRQPGPGQAQQSAEDEEVQASHDAQPAQPEFTLVQQRELADRLAQEPEGRRHEEDSEKAPAHAVPEPGVEEGPPAKAPKSSLS